MCHHRALLRDRIPLTIQKDVALSLCVVAASHFDVRMTTSQLLADRDVKVRQLAKAVLILFILTTAEVHASIKLGQVERLGQLPSH